MIHFANPNSYAVYALVGLTIWVLFRGRSLTLRAIEQLKLKTSPTLKGRIGFWAVILLLLTIAVMRPQGKALTTTQKVRSAHLVFAVDVSKSMLSDDVRPNRLERAKREIIDLLDELNGEHVALVIYSGSAFIQTPLTNDYGAFKTFLELADPGLSPLDGSNLQEGVIKSFEALGFDQENQSEKKGAIILFTDGETFQEEPTEIAEFARENSVPIFAYAIGTEIGGPIRLPNGLKKDRAGEIVITKADRKFLESFTESAGGFTVPSVAGNEDSNKILQAIAQLEPTEESTEEVQHYQEFFQIPLLMALCGAFAFQRRIEW